MIDDFDDTPTQDALDDARVEDTVHCSRCKAAWDICETYSVDGGTKSVCVECVQAVLDEHDAELARLRRELGEAREALSVADKSLSLAWQDLCEWRQFARYNVRGEICFEPGRIPETPQRPTEAGLAATELAIGEVMDAIRVVRKLSSPEAHPAPGGEGRETD